MLPTVLPTARSDRWSILDALIDLWFPPSGEIPGYTAHEMEAAEARAGATLPVALREWYERWGARRDVWSLQDHLRAPCELMVEDGALCFCTENQHVVRRGILCEDLGSEDPKVVMAGGPAGPGWSPESESTTSFALAFALMNVKWSDSVKHRANGSGPRAIEVIERNYQRLPLSDLNWPASSTRFFGHDELIIECQDNWLWVSARSRSAFAQADALLRAAGVAWEHWTSGD
jgi:hypothetical protein